MNLPVSSNSSSPSAKSSALGRKGGGRDLDQGLKLRAASSLAAAGYCCRINVALSATSEQGLSDVTDIDVLAIGYDLTFAPRIIAISCKAGEARSLSPAKELFYLRGVLDYVQGHEGALLLANKTVSPHHRDLARQLNILALSGGEVDAWADSLTRGVPNPGYFESGAYDDYTKAIGALPGPLGSFLKADYWFYRDFRNLQNLIGHLRKAQPRIDGKSKLHAVQCLDAAIHLCMAVMDVCFHVQRAGISRIRETVPAYLFGGNTSFKARRDLYKRVEGVLSATGVLDPAGPSLPSLEPTYTLPLAELALRFLERPQAATSVPLVLQDALWRALGAKGVEADESVNGLASIKLAEDLLRFLKDAADLPWVPEI